MATPAGSARRALLLIDFQKDFLEPAGRMPVDPSQVEPAINAAQNAVEEARSNGNVIVKIGNEFPSSDVFGNFFRRHAALRGTDGAAWDERIDPPEAMYVPKWKSSAFCNPDLAILLSEHQIDELLLAGLFAKACVSATAKAASKRGFRVQVIADGTACTNEKTRKDALAKLRRSGVGIV
jgi:nicotinamidase-related amidase